jgi:hypothetical protein
VESRGSGGPRRELRLWELLATPEWTSPWFMKLTNESMMRLMFL